MSFSHNLKTIRKQAGMTQKELSNELGVALSTIAMWETGSRQPDLETVKKISELFNISVDNLINDNEESTESDNQPIRITSKVKKMNQDLADLREMLRTRPEVKMLFSVSKNASKQDIERTVAIIEALKASSQGTQEE